MNILFLCDEYPPCKHGGIGSITQTLARELVSKGNNVFVIGFYPYFRKAIPFEVDFGVKVHRFFYGNYIVLKLSRHSFFGRFVNIEKKFNTYINEIKHLIIDNHIDLVEIPDFNESFRYTGPRLIRFPDFGIPSIVKTHGTYSFLNLINRNIAAEDAIYMKEFYHINSATKVVAVSLFIKHIVEEIYNYNATIDVLYNGISLTNNKFLKIRNASDNIVVYAGTICEGKGVFSLAKAWNRVVAVLPSSKLFLYGKGSKKDMLIAKHLILKENWHSVFFKGFIQKHDLLNVYLEASCAIFPSYTESFGLSPIEAMEAECPTIFTKRASGFELIENGIDGLLIDPDNIDEISDALLFLLKNKGLADKIGKRGKEKVKTKFNISLIADQHIELYRSLIPIK